MLAGQPICASCKEQNLRDIIGNVPQPVHYADRSLRLAAQLIDSGVYLIAAMRAKNYFEMDRVAGAINGPVGINVTGDVFSRIAAEIPRIRREDGYIIAMHRDDAHILILPSRERRFR